MNQEWGLHACMLHYAERRRHLDMRCDLQDATYAHFVGSKLSNGSCCFLSPNTYVLGQAYSLYFTRCVR